MEISDREAEAVLSALDSLALELTEHQHQWTPRGRRRYERAVAILRREKERQKRALAEHHRIVASADEAVMEAWKDTHAKRHKRSEAY